MPLHDIHDLRLYNISAFLHTTRFAKIDSTQERRIAATVQLIVAREGQDFIFQLAPTKGDAMARFNQAVFASVQLGRDDEKKFHEWLEKEKVHPVESVQRLLSDGFKISCSWISAQSSFCFSIIGTEETKKHAGVVMTTWADDLEEVMCLAAYKHYAVCGGDEWPTQADGTRWG